jgi:hypothetical protein
VQRPLLPGRNSAKQLLVLVGARARYAGVTSASSLAMSVLRCGITLASLGVGRNEFHVGEESVRHV